MTTTTGSDGGATEIRRYVLSAAGYMYPSDYVSGNAIVAQFDTLAEAIAHPIPHDALSGWIEDRDAPAGRKLVADWRREYRNRRDQRQEWREVVVRHNGIDYLDRGDALGPVVWSEANAFSALPL